MIVGAIKFVEMPTGGVAIEQVALTDQETATPAERTVAGIFDAAVKAAMVFVAQKTSENATMIEGKDIEEHVTAFLNAHHTESLRDQLKKAGFELPPQK
jgi:hypothetical protein